MSGRHARSLWMAGAIGTMMVAGALSSAGVASAADLTCTALPDTSSSMLDRGFGCAADAGRQSHALAKTVDGVAYGRADLGGAAMGLSDAGGVAAAESASGMASAGAFGVDAVSIVSADPGAVAFAVSLAGAQSFVGIRSEGVQCGAGQAVAVNMTTGQACVSDGTSVWSLPGF